MNYTSEGKLSLKCLVRWETREPFLEKLSLASWERKGKGGALETRVSLVKFSPRQMLRSAARGPTIE